MTTGPGSLLQAAAEADRSAPPFSFFSEVQEEAEKRLAESGEFTGERLFRDRPGVYAAAVRMIAEGQSISATSRALGISRNTVCAVRDREGVSVEQEKKQLLRDLRRASQLGVEKVLELLPETKAAKDAALVAAIMIDKQQLLSGEATSRVERVEVKPDQVKAFLDALPVVDAEVLEVISTGVPGETSGQKAAELEAPAPALPAPCSDLISDAPTALDSVGEPLRAMRRAKDEPADLEAHPGSGDGGGGGAAFDHAAPGVMDTEKQNFGQRPKAGRPAARDSALGDEIAGKPLCKRTTKKQKGGGPKRLPAKLTSPKEPTTKKRKGGSAS